MAVFTKRSHEGYLMIDHRASPGIPEEQARRMGLDPHDTREGRVLEAVTKRCCHCGVVVMVNPLRTRERGYCHKCDEYVCDWCVAASKEPGYVHRSFDEMADAVRSGKYVLSGTAVRPVLTFVGDQTNV